jgi:UDPglucose 6-dehydrogenase
MAGKHVAVLGVAFKAETDDIRDSAALTLIPALQQRGALVSAYDPALDMKGAAGLEAVRWCTNAYAAAAGADALVVLTEWNEFRGLDLARVASLMRRPVMIDLRNLYSRLDMSRTPFTYHSLGRAMIEPEAVEPAQ